MIDQCLEGVLIGLAVAIPFATAWRVMVRQDLTWAQAVALLAALLVHPVYMTRLAFRRKDRHR
jgi:hypothetical protein